MTMTYTPIDILPEDVAAGSACAVCGQPALHVIHISGFPDYIECRQCRSAFIFAEDQEHVLYGKINGNFPETREMALKQWILLDVVQRIAQKERSPGRGKTAEDPVPFVQAEAGQAEESRSVPGYAETPLAAAAQPGAPQTTPEPHQPAPADAVPAGKPAPAEPVPASKQLDLPAAAEVSPSPENNVTENRREQESPPPLPEIKQAEPSEKPGSFSALWKAEPMPAPDLLLDPGKHDRIQAAPPPAPPSEKAGLERSPVFIPPGNQAEAPSLPVRTTGKEEETERAAVEGKGVPKIQAREPQAGIRFRVVLSGSQIKFPYKVCSHCLTSPASSSLSMTAFLPDVSDSSQRVPTPIRIPLCTSCRKRASAQGEEEKQARSRAFLYSAGISLLLIFLLLLTGILGRLDSVFLGSFLILVTATIGYGIPLVILLERSSHFAPPADAFYVLSTLFLPSSPQQDMTVFDWRNHGYAELFHLANRSVTVKSVHEVDDQGPVLPQREPESAGAGPQSPHAMERTPPGSLLDEKIEKMVGTDNPDSSVV